MANRRSSCWSVSLGGAVSHTSSTPSRSPRTVTGKRTGTPVSSGGPIEVSWEAKVRPAALPSTGTRAVLSSRPLNGSVTRWSIESR